MLKIYYLPHICGWFVEISGLAFAGLGIGCFLVIGCEPQIRQMIDIHREDPATGRVTTGGLGKHFFHSGPSCSGLLGAVLYIHTLLQIEFGPSWSPYHLSPGIP